MHQYYVYHRTAEPGGKAIIHRGNCSSCNYGQGIKKTGPTRNGECLGGRFPIPFHEKREALGAAKSNGANRVDFCKFCEEE